MFDDQTNSQNNSTPVQPDYPANVSSQPPAFTVPPTEPVAMPEPVAEPPVTFTPPQTPVVPPPMIIPTPMPSMPPEPVMAPPVPLAPPVPPQMPVAPLSFPQPPVNNSSPVSPSIEPVIAPPQVSMATPPPVASTTPAFEGKGMGKYKVVVIKEKCIGAASCIAVASKAFKLNDQQIAEVISSINQETDDNLLLAAQSCPTLAIEVYDTTTGEKVWPR